MTRFCLDVAYDGAGSKNQTFFPSYKSLQPFMDNIKASAWINNPSLKLIEHKEKARTGLSHFELHFKQQSPTKPGEEETAT